MELLRRWCCVGIFAALACLAGREVAAVVMVPMPITELAAHADLVARGTVLAKSCQRDPHGRIYTRIEFEVKEVWKGTWDQPRLGIVHGGGTLGEQRVVVSGQVDYQIGEDAVVFLVFNQRGEAVTLGLAQGKFHLWKSEITGTILARNPFHGGAEALGAAKTTAAEPSGGVLTLGSLRQQVKGAKQ